MKLYVCEHAIKAYVLAETEEEAMACSREVLLWEKPEESCYETSSNELNWDLDYLVYHHDTDDITLREALEITKSQSEN